jgi:tRNA pseudouridine55 synthase
VLVIDKPQGLTSHDVVAAARRLLGERRRGHTGTLDPLATGVLPLACGRATRLVRFLMASDKAYEATIRFGITTDSYDATGRETGRSGRHPTRAQVAEALTTLTGEYLQTPPPYSAKRVGGRRAYAIAREQGTIELAPVPVRVSQAALTGWSEDTVSVSLTCSAGFYVRSFAHALGARVGTGACLEALRRTRSGPFSLDQSLTLDALQADPASAARRMVAMSGLLPDMPAVPVTAEGRQRIVHGRAVDMGQLAAPAAVDARVREALEHGRGGAGEVYVRLMDPEAELIAIGRSGTAPGALHPFVVLI